LDLFNRSLAKEIFNTEQIHHMARRGIKITKANIWDLTRNLIYCGKIFVTKYKDQESRFVKKLHEPLIFEELFYNVTNFLVTKDKHSIEKLLNVGLII